MTSRRVAIINGASGYVGPDLARLLARSGHDLVVGEITDERKQELEQLGATVRVAPDGGGVTDPKAAEGLVTTALDGFGRLDAAVAFTGAIVVGRFVRSTPEDLQRVLHTCIEAPYNFLRAVVPAMVERGGGQVLVFTSAAGGRPTPGAPLYSAARAGANMLVRNVAAEVARHGVQVNAIGTNFIDFPGFLEASRATDAEGRARVESHVPMARLGSVGEVAEMAVKFLDGTSRFATGQFVAVDGGWS